MSDTQTLDSVLEQLQLAWESGRHQDMLSIALHMTQAFNSLPLSWQALGLALQALGRHEEAEQALRHCHRLDPDDAEACNTLGICLTHLGRPAEALSFYQQAVALEPDYAEARFNLGLCLHGLGHFTQAEAHYRHAIACQSDFAQAHNNLGVTLEALGQQEAAAQQFRNAVALQPDFVDAHVNLGRALLALHALHEAETSLRRALQLAPGHAGAHLDLGSVLAAQGRLFAAEQSCRAALRARPDYVGALNNLGNVLKNRGELQAALDCYREAITRRPDFLQAHSNLLFLLHYTGAPVADCLRQASEFGRIASALAPQPFASWGPSRAGAPLRVGLVSGDLRQHPVAVFLEQVMRSTDPARLQWLAYPTARGEDAVTRRLRALCSHWQPLLGLDDRAAAQRIHADAPDVLIDLAGHTAHNRLGMFAWKPARVQVSWLGYFGTTGLAAMDYVLGDPFVTPPGQDAHFVERLWRLPHSYLCFTPPAEAPPVAPLPALQRGQFSFGCCNNLSKLNDEVIALWSAILSAVHGARLVLKAEQLGDPDVQAHTLARFQAHGIDPGRLALSGGSPRLEYLQHYGEIDLCLDPFPYPGGTTSVESLWMGVPVLTLRGDRFLANNGAGIASNAGLADWIAQDTGDYLAKAVAATRDLPALAALRAGLRDRVQYSPLCDGPAFASALEEALRGMCDR